MQNYIVPPKEFLPCISLIGMAGAGKSTLAKLLAKRLSWSMVDTDHAIEASYGTILQNITDKLSKDEFLDVEAQVLSSLRLARTVIATGGSVVYRETSMQHLATLGFIVHIVVDLPVILKRIARNPNRGLAIAPGQSIEDLFYEREELYKRYATHSIDATYKNPKECVDIIISELNLQVCI